MALVRRVLTAVALIASTLSIASTTHADAASSGPRINPRTGLPVGFLPMKHLGAKTAATFSPASTQPAVDFQYWGGPVVANAAVENVLWGAGSASPNYLPEVAGTSGTGDINTVLSEMLTTQWARGLSEYSTPTQTIGTGSLIDRRAITPSVGASGTSIDDSTIQSELIAQVSTGALAVPTANTVYTLYFPHGTTVCDASMGSACSPVEGADNSNAFCAYHGATATTYNGMHLLYVVQPYPDAFYLTGCGSPGDTQLAALESTVSHELSETITDPLAALASTNSPPLGWYDLNYGEVADLCQAGMGPWTWHQDAVGYKEASGTWFDVQQVWSNSYRACVPGPPQRVVATSIPGGHIKVSWSAPADQAGNPEQGYDVLQYTASGWQKAASVGGTSWTSPSAPYGHTVAFTIIAWGQSYGDLWHTVSNKVAAVSASMPSAVPWLRTLRGGTSPIVGWAGAAPNGAAITKYILSGPGGTRTLSPYARSFHWGYLKHGRYLVTVRAVNRMGYGVIRRFTLVN